MVSEEGGTQSTVLVVGCGGACSSTRTCHDCSFDKIGVVLVGDCTASNLCEWHDSASDIDSTPVPTFDLSKFEPQEPEEFEEPKPEYPRSHQIKPKLRFGSMAADSKRKKVASMMAVLTRVR